MCSWELVRTDPTIKEHQIQLGRPKELRYVGTPLLLEKVKWEESSPHLIVMD